MKRDPKFSRPEITRARKHISEKAGIAIARIEKDLVTPEQLELLLDALEGFNNGTLQEVHRAPLRHEELERFDLPIAALGLSKADSRRLTDLGVRYIGEMYCIAYNEERVGIEYLYQAFDRAVTLLGMPWSGTDPLRSGWRPRYWDNEDFLQALNQPLLEVLEEPKDSRHGWPRSPKEHHYEGTHFFGQVLRELEQGHGRTCAKLRRLQQILKTSAVWAGAVVPPSWTPPEEEPAVWLAAKASVEKGHRQLAREHLDKPISSALNWNTRERCANKGIRTYKDLAEKTEQDLRRLHFGKHDINQFSKALETVYLRLGMTSEEIDAIRRGE